MRPSTWSADDAVRAKRPACNEPNRRARGGRRRPVPGPPAAVVPGTPPGCVAAEAKTGPPRPPSRCKTGRPAQAPCAAPRSLSDAAATPRGLGRGAADPRDTAFVVGALPPAAGEPGRACGDAAPLLGARNRAAGRRGGEDLNFLVTGSTGSGGGVWFGNLWHYDYKSRKQYRHHVSAAARPHDPPSERRGSRRLRGGGVCGRWYGDLAGA